MSKKEICDAIEEMAGLSSADAHFAYTAVVGYLRATLAARGRVALPEIGTFEVKVTKARTGRNPATGEVIQIPAGKRVAFRPVLPSARIEQHGDEWTYDGWPACEAATPALALCAAFCRAMAEKTKTDR